MTDVARRADRRRAEAELIAQELRLVERWSEVGEPIIVGAMAHNLMAAPDIDMEIYCPNPTVRAGFSVLAACAENPRITKARFANLMDGPDQGFYFQLRYRHPAGGEWKMDMWLVANDHPGPLGRNLIEPLRRALTPGSREAILTIKEFVRARDMAVPSIQIYQAVLSHGVQGPDAFVSWWGEGRPLELTYWHP